MNRRVVDPRSLPIFMPIQQTALGYLLLEHFHAPGWAYGAASVLALIVWIVFIIDAATRQHVNVLPPP